VSMEERFRHARERARGDGAATEAVVARWARAMSVASMVERALGCSLEEAVEGS
jgi:hypothetical protein